MWSVGLGLNSRPFIFLPNTSSGGHQILGHQRPRTPKRMDDISCVWETSQARLLLMLRLFDCDGDPAALFFHLARHQLLQAASTSQKGSGTAENMEGREGESKKNIQEGPWNKILLQNLHYWCKDLPALITTKLLSGETSTKWSWLHFKLR